MMDKKMLRQDRCVQIKGFVTIRQGDKVIVRMPNHFVDAGLKGIISTIIFASLSGGSGRYWYLWSNSWNMYIGSDTTNPTITTMTALASPIGTAPGTPPNSKSIASVKDGSGDGIWNAVWQATWNAGTVSGTLGEAALYMRAPDKTTFGWAMTSTYTPASVMVSRLASADGDFSSFVIDDTVPLTVEWTVQLSFV